jgi:hypothetical protein
MRKSLVIALGTIMLVLTGKAALANAPVFSEIPDVIIGDRDFNEQLGLTVDYNFFRYINAFNVLGYVSDNDTTLTDLKFAFTEGPVLDVDNDLSINDHIQLRGSEIGSDDGTWGPTKELTGGSNFWMSFRDIVRSPGTGNPGSPFGNPHLANGTEVTSPTVAVLPWHNLSGQPGVLGSSPGEPDARSVTLWAADADQSASQTLLVFSINNENNDLSGGFRTLFTSAPFSSWEYDPFGSAGLGAATSSGGSTFIGLAGGQTASSGGANFARWQTKVVPNTANYQGLIPAIDSNEVYLARFSMSANTLSAGHPSSKTYLAQVRIGVQQAASVNEVDVNINAMRQTSLNLDSQLPDLGTTKNYDVMWSPLLGTPEFDDAHLLVPFPSAPGGVIDARTWRAYFDMVDADRGAPENEGLWRLESFVVGAVARPADLPVSAPASERFLLTNLTSSGGFATMLSVSGDTITQGGSAGAGTITINDPGRPGGSGNYITYEKAPVVSWLADKVVRVTVQMSCPTTTDRNNYHKTRIRHNVIGLNIYHMWILFQAGTPFPGAIPAAPIARDSVGYTAPTSYEVYLPAFGGPSADQLALGGDYSKWLAGIDQINGDGSGTALNPTHVTVHQVLYEILDQPAVP